MEWRRSGEERDLLGVPDQPPCRSRAHTYTLAHRAPQSAKWRNEEPRARSRGRATARDSGPCLTGTTPSLPVHRIFRPTVADAAGAIDKRPSDGIVTIPAGERRSSTAT